MAVPVLVVDPRPLIRRAISHLLGQCREFAVGEAASSLQDLFLRAPGDAPWVAVVGAPALRDIGDQELREGTRGIKAGRILVLGDEYKEDTICHLLTLGCSGYLCLDTSPEILSQAILAVARGEIWAERHLVTRTLQQALSAGSSAPLTTREREILGLVREGHNKRQIAALLLISPETVRWHMRRAFGKIGAKSRAEAIGYARDHNIFPRQDSRS